MHRSDENQNAIVKVLREGGASVAILSQLGGGIPDLLIAHRGITYLAEVKNPSGRGRRFTRAEILFRQNWKGIIFLLESVEDALQLLSLDIIVDGFPPLVDNVQLKSANRLADLSSPRARVEKTLPEWSKQPTGRPRSGLSGVLGQYDLTNA